MNQHGRMLVRGPSCTGNVFLRGAPATFPGIFVADNLELSDYDLIVSSTGVICAQCEITSHIGVICRIVGIPVLLVPDATRLYRQGDLVTLDTEGAVVHAGHIALSPPPVASEQDMAYRLFSAGEFRYQVSIIDAPDMIRRANALGRNDLEHLFLREEFLWIARHLNPFAYLETHGANGLAQFLEAALASLLAELSPSQTLNFRSLDVRSSDSAVLGALAHPEPNPHLGLHGIRHTLQNTDYLYAELVAVDRLYDRGFSNIVFSLPFLALEDELAAVLSLRDRFCHNPIKLGVFVETPAAVSELPQLLRRGIHAVYVGTKDLAQLILGADRDNPNVAHILSVRRRPVIAAIRKITRLCHSAGRPAFVFAYIDDVPFLQESVPHLSRLSLPAADYIRALGPA